jgi:hypothetical protein
MWEPRHLTILWAFTACYRESFAFFTVPRSIHNRFLTNPVQFIIHPSVVRASNGESVVKTLSKNILEIVFICSFRGSRISLLRLKIRVSCHFYFHKSGCTTSLCAHFFNPDFFERISVHHSPISILTFRAVSSRGCPTFHDFTHAC